MSDIVERLRRWTHSVDAAPASDLMDEAAGEIERLREAVHRYLAEQDATLSVCNAAATVTMDAEIDALEFVVEEGRIASQMDYGVLRSLLVRLRPEWLDRPEPIKDEESDRSKPIAHTPPTQTTPGEDSKPGEGT